MLERSHPAAVLRLAGALLVEVHRRLGRHRPPLPVGEHNRPADNHDPHQPGGGPSGLRAV